MGLFLILAVDAFVLLFGFLCFFKPEKVCKGDRWKTAGENFEPSEQYIRSMKHRGILILIGGALLTVCIAVMIYFGIRDGQAFSGSEFFEWFITRKQYKSSF